MPGNFELAVYGPNAALPDAARSHAIFRRHGFSATPWLVPGIIPGCDSVTDDAASGDDLAWGMDAQCGLFLFSADASTDVLDQVPDMVGTYEDVSPPDGAGATIVTLDERMRVGLDMYAERRLHVRGRRDARRLPHRLRAAVLDEPRQPGVARGDGLPAHGREQLPAQRGAARHAARADRRVRHQPLLAAQPAGRGRHPRLLQPVTARRVRRDHAVPHAGDLRSVHEVVDRSDRARQWRGRHAAPLLGMVLLDSLAQSMWWNKPERFGPSMEPEPAPRLARPGRLRHRGLSAVHRGAQQRRLPARHRRVPQRLRERLQRRRLQWPAALGGRDRPGGPHRLRWRLHRPARRRVPAAGLDHRRLVATAAGTPARGCATSRSRSRIA